ncbi:MAG: M23 family metallopeptidase [Verrucomicrobia bacterium]|jgi:murein DD-endopeptidase MepM/ murein hydrolase activator NlpD|nr:M23 family metallopeptidase [Verrucomicrobiota bacterium]MBT5619802.1 M23 family metallopeptidase [Verrucomicrobiota bacterium]MBT7027021.1 M23 family metallopeptidase [Verrucomicrobiota bacterium]MBT7735231.1 M23 family metallopeptidase [Verrucomicrobiota bacterium]MBT7909183.1 M23 family metallopeptidase [Verrucomicrobiota bacterium]
MTICRCVLLTIALGQATAALGQPFQLPTPNRAIFEAGKEADYFTPTVGRAWPSGTFGCVRSEGWQMHEGIDIKCTQRDAKGEPVDPVSASADGTIVHINAKPSLSNYGNYIVIQHQVDGLTVYTLYAHLRAIASGLAIGQAKKTGEIIATMGRTSNTRQRISRVRAHLHFEICLLTNPNFSAWLNKNLKDQRNDHDQWNGQNLMGIDPWKLFLDQHQAKAKRQPFNLRQFIRSQPVLCRVLVKSPNFRWAKRYPNLVESTKEPGAIAGYEISLDPNGVPIRSTPRDASAFSGSEPFKLLHVDPDIYKQFPCRKLLFKKGQQWVLTSKGISHLKLLAY